jgi:hypothetical protein
MLVQAYPGNAKGIAFIDTPWLFAQVLQRWVNCG